MRFYSRRLLRTLERSLDDPSFLGKEGEIRVRNQLLIDAQNNHTSRKFIKNLYIKDNKDNTHEIDHIEIRKNGIFAIEIKNYHGFIKGNESSLKWFLFINGHSYFFFNPIKQNESHVKVIEQVLNNKYKVNSVIVFIDSDISSINIPNVISLINLTHYINSFVPSDGIILSEEDMNEIYEILMNTQVKVNKDEHIQQIKEKKDSIIEKGLCPKCGQKLVQYTSRDGSPFYCCKNYPKCVFVYKPKK